MEGLTISALRPAVASSTLLLSTHVEQVVVLGSALPARAKATRTASNRFQRARGQESQLDVISPIEWHVHNAPVVDHLALRRLRRIQ